MTVDSIPPSASQFTLIDFSFLLVSISRDMLLPRLLVPVSCICYLFGRLSHFFSSLLFLYFVSFQHFRHYRHSLIDSVGFSCLQYLYKFHGQFIPPLSFVSPSILHWLMYAPMDKN